MKYISLLSFVKKILLRFYLVVSAIKLLAFLYRTSTLVRFKESNTSLSAWGSLPILAWRSMGLEGNLQVNDIFIVLLIRHIMLVKVIITCFWLHNMFSIIYVLTIWREIVFFLIPMVHAFWHADMFYLNLKEPRHRQANTCTCTLWVWVSKLGVN